VCGRRFGKTWYIKERLSFLSQNPKKLYWYIAPTYGMARDLLWDDLKAYWDKLKWGYKKDEQRLMLTRLRTGTVIQLKSAEKERSLLGKGLNGVFFDEFSDIKPNIWYQSVRPALSDKLGFAEFFGTPRGHNHFYQLFNDAKTKDNWSYHQFMTIDSPYFQTPQGLAEIEEAKRDLDPRTFRQEYEASFETFGGRIVYAFDRAQHDTDYHYDPNLPIYIGQDFNRNPMSGVLFQKVAGKMIAFEEMVIPTSSTQEVCDIIRQKYPQAIYRGVIFRPDASGARRTSNSSRSDHQIIKDNGYTVETKLSNPRRIDRWAACNRALEQGLCLINTKKCPKLVKELESVVYKEGTCEPDIKDALTGHVFDAFGYNLHYEYPIIKTQDAFQYNY